MNGLGKKIFYYSLLGLTLGASVQICQHWPNFSIVGVSIAYTLGIYFGAAKPV
jgi:hypothetical protein